MTVDELDRVVTMPPRRWRPWRRGFRVRWRWVVAVAVVVLVAFAAWVVFFSSWLGLRSVDVEGAPASLAGQVRAAVDVAPGTPLERIDLGAVRARVEKIPVVASAAVSRQWPHGLVVRVTERQPVGIIHTGGAWQVLDKEGVVFAPAAVRTRDEPIVALAQQPGLRTLSSVGHVLGSMPVSLRTQTRRITASSMDSIHLILKNGSVVRWGSPAQSSEKAAVLAALMHHKASLYDVTIPSQPATSG